MRYKEPSSAGTSKIAAVSVEGSQAPKAPGAEAKHPGQGLLWPAPRKTLHHFFPNLPAWLASTPDPPDPRFIVYPIAYLLMSGILLFLTKLGSRRQMRFHFTTSHFIQNLNHLLGTSCQTMLHPHTLAFLANRLPQRALEDLRQAMVYGLLRKKVFDKARLLKKYHLVVMEGRGHLVLRQRHCEHCLTQHHGSVTLYYHPVL